MATPVIARVVVIILNAMFWVVEALLPDSAELPSDGRTVVIIALPLIAREISTSINTLLDRGGVIKEMRRVLQNTV
jgi:hypothetical protein